MDRYVARLEEALGERGFRGRFHLMQSSGGIASPEMARAFPIRLLESGPAGGGLATAFFGARAGKPDVISFDMGGTTAKACLIEDGRPDVAPMMEAARVHRFKRGSGLPIKAPVIDMIEIGAGGGSIARVDEVGLLKVGPHSAGADPGPACYGQGGEEPTVTDANLLLGYYDRALLPRRPHAARSRRRRGGDGDGWRRRSGFYRSPPRGASTASCARAWRPPRACTSWRRAATRGATPWSASAARAPRMRREWRASSACGEVIVPPASGAASALGFLVGAAELRVLELVARRARRARSGRRQRAPRRSRGQGAAPARRRRRRRRRRDGHAPAEMRLVGQVHDITVRAAGRRRSPPASLDAVKQAFETAYARLYTHVYRGTVIQAINWRVRCAGPAPSVHVARDEGGAAPRATRKGTRAAYFGDAGGWVDAPVYDRYALRPGDRIEGPAIIEEREATTVVPPGDRLEVDAELNLRLHVAGSTALEPRGAGGHGARARGGAHRGRSDRARDHVEPARHRRRGDVAHRRAAPRSR